MLRQEKLASVKLRSVVQSKAVRWRATLAPDNRCPTARYCGPRRPTTPRQPKPKAAHPSPSQKSVNAIVDAAVQQNYS